MSAMESLFTEGFYRVSESRPSKMVGIETRTTLKHQENILLSKVLNIKHIEVKPKFIVQNLFGF